MKLFCQIFNADVLAIALVFSVVIVFINEQTNRLEADRRSVALSGLAGSVRSGAALAHSIWVTEGANASQIALANGRTIEIDLQTGYPLANAGELSDLLPAIDGISSMTEGETVVFTIADRAASNCNVTYTTGASDGAPPRVTVRSNLNGGDCS